MNLFVYVSRIIRTGFRNFFRNGWLSVAATTIMVITLFTISIFAILNIGITQGAKSIQDKIDVAAYLNDDIDANTLDKLKLDLSSLPDVKEIIYISKADAVKTYRDQNKNNPSIASISNDDLMAALPASLSIKAKNTSHLQAIKDVLERKEYKPFIHNSSYQGDKEKTINRLVRITNFVKTAGFALSTIFIATSLLVIFNTVRIAIFTRREEIEIMKLVGATSTFIRWPFIIEGATYGTIATAISLLVQYLAISFGAPSVMNYLQISGITNVFDYFSNHIVLVILVQLAVGVLIGVTSSFIAIRRYLRIIGT
jgi:cell division transport system permease protein